MLKTHVKILSLMAVAFDIEINFTGLAISEDLFEKSVAEVCFDGMITEEGEVSDKGKAYLDEITQLYKTKTL